MLGQSLEEAGGCSLDMDQKMWQPPRRSQWGPSLASSENEPAVPLAGSENLIEKRDTKKISFTVYTAVNL